MQKILVASGPVIVEGGKVLLAKHGDTSFWKFCGGRVEDFSYDLREHCRREAREETGVDLVFADAPPFFLYTQKQTDEGVIDVILVHFLASRVGEVVPGEDMREVAWIPFEQLPQEDLGPNILPALRHFGFIS